MSSNAAIINEVPPELLARIFVHLPYTPLLKIQRVCKRWNAVVKEDPALSLLLFKNKSGKQSASWPRKQAVIGAEPTARIHPAAQIALYSIGSSPKDIKFKIKSLKSPEGQPGYDYSDYDDWPSLANLSVANDFFVYPCDESLDEDLDSEDSDGSPTWGDYEPLRRPIKVVNKDGVRVADVFKAISKAAKKPLYDSEMSCMAEYLGETNNNMFDGFNNIYHDGETLSMYLKLTG
ncbi:hypothetical protein MKEN_01152200 [Mycena kentingensis (nom. inval.)]|nr:hypothetical protein MKEN_01152200 [Mycena kentingensis (nom. inval.)]